MKPRTKLEKRVVELSAQLPALTQQQEAWMVAQAPVDMNDFTAFYCAVATSVEEFQVLRVYNVIVCDPTRKDRRIMKRTEHFHFYVQNECYQIWITPAGKTTIMALDRKGLGAYYCRACFQWLDYGLSIKHDRKLYYGHFYNCECPIWYESLSSAFDNALYHYNDDETLDKYDMRYLAEALFTSQLMRDLWKRGQHTLFKQFYQRMDEVKRYEPYIRMALNCGYNITEASLWLDHVKFIEEINKAFLTPKNVCPRNLRQEHDRWYKMVKRKRRIEANRRADEQRKRDAMTLKEQRETFFKHIAAYKGVDIQRENFHIFPCMTPEDMIEEGTQMDHCVGGYWRKADSLILLARTYEDARIATIEVDMKRWEIVQCYGKHNHTPQYNDEIRAAIGESMQMLRRLHEKRLKETTPNVAAALEQAQPIALAA